MIESEFDSIEVAPSRLSVPGIKHPSDAGEVSAFAERERRPVLRRVIRILHLAWGLPCLVIAVMLAGADGHPPGLIFVPVVVVVWGLGHLTLLLTRILAERSAAGRRPERWPWSIIVGVAGSGVVSFVGMLAMAWPFLGGGGLSDSDVPGIALATVVHAAAFVGLLARRRWARWLGGILAGGWGLLLLVQIADHVGHGRPVEMIELGVALLLLTALAVLAVQLLAGPGPRRYT